jgi:hypothetical protein
MKNDELRKAIVIPELLKTAEIKGMTFSIDKELVELNLRIYHRVELKLKDMLDYFSYLGFKLVNWDEDEWYDFDKYKITYLIISTNRDILGNHGNTIEVNDIYNILQIPITTGVTEFNF